MRKVVRRAGCSSLTGGGGTPSFALRAGADRAAIACRTCWRTRRAVRLAGGLHAQSRWDQRYTVGLKVTASSAAPTWTPVRRRPVAPASCGGRSFLTADGRRRHQSYDLALLRAAVPCGAGIASGGADCCRPRARLVPRGRTRRTTTSRVGRRRRGRHAVTLDPRSRSAVGSASEAGQR